VTKNERECQKGVSSILRGGNVETTGSKRCVDLRDQQQLGVGRAYRTCRDVVAKKRAEVSRLRGVEGVVLFISSCIGTS